MVALAPRLTGSSPIMALGLTNRCDVFNIDVVVHRRNMTFPF